MIEIEQEQKDNITKLCSLVRENKGFIEISKVPEDLKSASETALSKSLIVISADETKYKITELGKMYAEE